jgi:hypothetical protein
MRPRAEDAGLITEEELQDNEKQPLGLWPATLVHRFAHGKRR